MTGADLCTGSFMYTSLAALHRRTSILLMLRHWFITFFGNLAGALFVTCVIIGYGGVFSGAAYRKELLSIATTKAVTPEWHQIFLKAIGANWLVCLACFLACCAREFFSKVCAMWTPVFAFVLLGLDHVVANMFYIPLAVSCNSILCHLCTDSITIDFPSSSSDRYQILHLEKHDSRCSRQHRRWQCIRLVCLLVPLHLRRYPRSRHRWRLLGRSQPFFHQLFLRPSPSIQQG